MSFATGPMMEDVNAQPTTLMQMPQLALHSPYQMHGYGLSETSAQNTLLNAQIAQYGQTLSQPAGGSLFQYAAPTAVQTAVQNAVQNAVPQLPTQSLYSVAPPQQPLAQSLAQPLAQNLAQPLTNEHATATGQLGWSVEPVAAFNAQKMSEASKLKTYKSPEAMAKEMFSIGSDDVHLPHVHQGMLNHKKAIQTLAEQHKTVVARSHTAMKTLSKQGKVLDQQDVGLKSQKSAIMTMQKELGRLGRDLDAVRTVRSRSEGPPSARRTVAKQDPVKTQAAAAPVARARQIPVKTQAAAAPAKDTRISFEMKELADTKSQLMALAQKLDKLETGTRVDTVNTVAPKAQNKRPDRTKARVQITEVDTGTAVARVGRPRSKANRTWVE